MADFDFKEIFKQPDPPDRQVWAVCKYLEAGKPCQKCPRSSMDEQGEEWQRGCYTAAAETIKAVYAAQKGE